MSISIYTCVKNGLYLDYHVAEMLRHHLPLADEIIVNDGFSTDGTLERISSIDSKVKVFRSDWGTPSGQDWFVHFKESARRRCTGDWCILLDPDEFIPEWEFDRIKKLLENTDRHIVRLRWIHFYGNYKVYNANPSRRQWAEFKYQIHRNLDDMQIWGDGSNVRLKGRDYTSTVDDESIVCHHFGVVRKPARLRQKFRYVDQVVSGRLSLLNIPNLIFDLMPYNWFDKDFIEDLAVYEGPYIQAVREKPEEFVRDNFKLYNYIKNLGNI
jgi:glycosyltransferase involved in cell wall biosynthesis